MTGHRVAEAIDEDADDLWLDPSRHRPEVISVHDRFAVTRARGFARRQFDPEAMSLLQIMVEERPFPTLGEFNRQYGAKVICHIERPTATLQELPVNEAGPLRGPKYISGMGVAMNRFKSFAMRKLTKRKPTPHRPPPIVLRPIKPGIKKSI